MKSWHWGLIIAVLVAYLVGVKWPGPGTSLLSKIGM